MRHPALPGPAKMNRTKQILTLIFGLLILGSGFWFIYHLIRTLASYISALPKELGASLIAGIATVLVATLTVVTGRYFERKKELDALYRERKTEIYDEFLKRFFELVHSDTGVTATTGSDDFVQFLREFMRKLILWSSPEVIESFVKWKDQLAKGVPDAESIFLTEQFLLSVRNDLRNTNSGIKKGFFAKLFLKEGALFLTLAAKNPKITLAEMAEIEKLTKRQK
jgi:hypothetical protein